MQTAKRNLMIMWFANFFIAASATMIMPFLSLYIETFGNFSESYVQRWAGFVFAATFVTAFFISPLWGRFGDKNGYKKILLITGTGIAISIFLMGYVTSVGQLFFLRLFMGAVTGFIPTSLALISAQTPKEIAGRTLGTLQMGNVSGSLFGPLLGGMLADAVGFQYTFVLTSTVILLATLLVAVGVKEVRPTEESLKLKKYTRKEVIVHIFHNPVLLTIIFISFLIQVGNFSIQPLLALYVTELSSSSNIAFLAGLAFSATGFGNLLFTRQWGKLGDQNGHERILMILMIAAAILFIPQALVTDLWQLVLCRFIFGMAVGGIIPCMTAYIRQVAPLSMQGEVLGYNQSFKFLGNVIGPITGGIISGFFGISSVFFVTSGLFLLGAVILWMSVVRQSEKSQHHAA
ncbi:MFS transporter [Fredinandcohnia sp. SECRCQ15]|uniref:MFS transporter n=2 Tax=Fredinandcohnia quinoae TaxID=2918902 RepID=A0AAW5E1Q6_9BACI|nr:MFS transporter [Fredinandcohnia sp. SECRCQ15]